MIGTGVQWRRLEGPGIALSCEVEVVYVVGGTNSAGTGGYLDSQAQTGSGCGAQLPARALWEFLDRAGMLRRERPKYGRRTQRRLVQT
jgi:hypothetical protein